MPDIDETLAALGLDEPDPAHLAGLWGSLLAEPDVLQTWAEHSQHPRLAAAYHALHERVRERSQTTRTRIVDDIGPARLDHATETASAEAHAIEFELSRLKWLLANRAQRSAAADALGPHYDHDADAAEADILHELLGAVGRGLC